MWLQWGSEHGIFMPLFFLLMITSLLLASVKNYLRDGKTNIAGLCVIILSMIISSNFEYDFIIGHRGDVSHFHFSALWWAAVGILLHKISEQKNILPIRLIFKKR